MKILYFDCAMGAAGDMLSAALLELMPDREKALTKLNALGIPGIVYSAEKSVKCGIAGTHMTVTYEGEEEGCEQKHTHSRPGDIKALISGLNMSETARKNAKAVYDLIAQAEAEVHGVPMEDIHFHEVGTMDAVADVAAVCCLMDALSPQLVVCSPVCVGFGQIKCAHGILPVPAPATAKLLEGVPVYSGELQGEMCTPTGAALIKYFADDFDKIPDMTLAATGCGMGKRDYSSRANCLRALTGDLEGSVAELRCNVDDMTPEAVGYAMEALMKAGALDVYWQSIGMKKSRPGLLLTCLCRSADRDRMVELIFRHTSTIGIRETLCSRYVLKRETGLAETPWGPVRTKASGGWGVERTKPEFDDMAKIAEENDLSLEEVRKIVMGGHKDA